MQTVLFQDLHNIEYGAAWQYQEDLLKQNLAIKADKTSVETTINHLLFCSHPHVYTLGKSGHMENLLVNDTRMKELMFLFTKQTGVAILPTMARGKLWAILSSTLKIFLPTSASICAASKK